MMKRLLLSLFAVLLIPVQGWGQASVLQGGSWTTGSVPVYSGSGGTSQPVVQNSGPASGTGVGVKELSVIARGTGTAPFVGQGTGQLGTVVQIQDAPSTNSTGYHALSFSANVNSGGLIAYNAYGGAAALPLRFNINGSSYDFPAVLSGVVGPSSTTVGNFAVWNNTSGTLLADGGSQVSLAQLPTLAAYTVLCNKTGSSATPTACADMKLLPQATGSVIDTFGTPTILATGNGLKNAIVGAVRQTGTGGYSYPTGVTGYASNENSGNTAFGLFGRCDLGITGSSSYPGTCTNEINSFNFNGSPSSTLPPDISFGTTQNNAIALQLVAYGDYDSSIGLQFVGSGSTKKFYVGQYYWPGAADYAGLILDATSSVGPDYGVYIKSPSSTGAIPLQIQSIGSLTANNAAIVVADNSNTARFSVSQVGNVTGHAWFSSGVNVPTVSTCTGVGGGGTCAVQTGSSDGAGTIIVTAGSAATAGGGTIGLTFNSAIGTNASACTLQVANGTGTWEAASTLTVTAQTTAAMSFSYLNGPPTGTAFTNGSTYLVNYFCPGR